MAERLWELWAWNHDGSILHGRYDSVLLAMRDAWHTFGSAGILSSCVRHKTTGEYAMWLDVCYVHPEEDGPLPGREWDDDDAADRWEDML